MIRLLIFFLFCNTLAYGQHHDWSEFDTSKSVNCIFYLNGDSLPYTGTVLEKHFGFKKNIIYLENGLIASDTLFRFKRIKSYCIDLVVSDTIDNILPDSRCFNFSRRGDLKTMDEFREGSIFGDYVRYYRNGQIKYQGKIDLNGFMTSYWIYYRKNGSIQSAGNMLNGKDTGIWTWYDDEGNVAFTEEYEDGKKVKE
ncbi:MAG: hypothetical protein HOG05_05550 [Bacteroidetes bacterium]|jgi:antitoxin component YwqK of YwqJK toxin-antitoxin module|nr:hypothetical protein [Bacteroidota bacterium]MBT3423733.1 hypothetical protein [Bacteroidota bacterium]MBT3800596.1 hypothetical protein [Bacteroidota bacterium]MBT3934558.1 hypothetical protein [Bacteroidota bacterium]MBT4727194.1 hypothetical protein [Bacteroidota bacterium]